MRWVQSEYALKGLFLALLFYTALQIQILPTLPAGEVRSADDEMRLAWQKTGSLALYLLGGLAVGIILGLLRQIRDLSRIFVKPHAFLLFLLLENPLLIYLGLIGGLGLGAFLEFEPETQGRPNLILMAIIGLLLGVGFGRLREIEDSRRRMALVVIVGAIVIYFVNSYLEKFNGGKFLSDPKLREMLGFHILLGLPFFYLLCFVGIAEESEAEIAGLCTMLGLAIHLLNFPERMPAAGFLLPITFYFVYSVYVLPDLRVFKHTLRGYIYMEVGKLRSALLSFRRALQLDPKNQLAQQGMDALHANIEIEKVDAATLGLLDPNRCLKRVRQLLGQKPTADQLKKAHHILDLVEKLWPKLTSHVIYYRAVAAVHAGEMDKACDLLNDLLNPEGWFTDDVARKTILFDAWQLVLLVHPVLKQRVGEPQLALPGRRMEAIAAVERQMTIQPNDPTIQEFRKSLYEDLPEDEYFAIAQQAPPTDFAHRFVEEIGARLIPNFELWKRGAQFLRMAAHGQPLRRPVIYQKLAEAFAKAGETLEATGYLQKLRDSGLEVGLTTLPDDQRTIYFGTVRRLADEAAARGDIDEAIYNYSLATRFNSSR